MDIVQTFLDIALLGSAWVLWLLVMLSVVSVAIIIERIVYYKKLHHDFGSFQEKLTMLLVKKDIAGAKEFCQSSESLESDVAIVGLDNTNVGQHGMEELMASRLINEKQNLDRGLVVLGTLGNNAPFIGLFGTVLGIIEAFNSLAANAAGGPSVVMAGISEALVATAVGLLVAIPAVIAFNTFQRFVKRHLSNSESIMKTVTAHLGTR